MSDAAKASNRRSGSERRQRAGMVNFRANAEELAEIIAAAERAGLTASAYVRSRVLEKPVTRATRRPPIEKALLAQILGQIGKVGSNVNQIARAENRGREVPDLEEALQQAFADLAQMKSALMAALGRGVP